MNNLLLKNRFSFIFTLFFIATAFLGCEGGAEVVCYEEFTPGANTVTGPVETTVNTPVELAVTFNVYTSCGKFVKFTESPMSENTKEIAIQAEYEGCECEGKTFVRTAPYTFTAAQPGTYILKFHKSSLTFVTHTIVVN